MEPITVKINPKNIDEAIEKVSRLNELLKEAISLINSLIRKE